MLGGMQLDCGGTGTADTMTDGIPKLNFSKDSSLRKLMRAMRSGRVPDERIVIIDIAERKARSRRAVYRHKRSSHAS